MNLFLNPIFAEATTQPEGLTKYPIPLFSIGGFPITNSMISEMIVTGIIIAVIQIAMRTAENGADGHAEFR